jgi:hypothetical protein
VEYPDRLEAAHVRHEHVDQHHVESRGFKRAETRIATLGNDDLEAVLLQTDLNGRANHWVVIDH